MDLGVLSSMRSRDRPMIIVGGGVMGVCCAYFLGSAFAAALDARQCSGSAGIVIGGRAIAALVAAPSHVSDKTAAPTAASNGARKGRRTKIVPTSVEVNRPAIGPCRGKGEDGFPQKKWEILLGGSKMGPRVYTDQILGFPTVKRELRLGRRN